MANNRFPGLADSEVVPVSTGNTIPVTGKRYR